jgi:4-aminobutyrate aminotransferase-like enzyme
MKEEKLVDNVREVGTFLGELLHEYLDWHPHVGNVRGKGLFWGVSSLAYSKLNETLTDP